MLIMSLLEELERYAIELARPVFCETVLGRFLQRVRKEAQTREDVKAIFLEIRQGKANGTARNKLRLVT
jgi:hypothetical protein